MFNTLRYAKILEEAGFSREQAETSIKILVEIMEDKLATKQDIQGLARIVDLHELRVDVQKDMHELESRLRLDLHDSLSNLESKLTTRMGAMLMASVTLVTAMIAVVHKLA